MQNHDRRSAAIYGLLAAAWVGVLFFFSGQSGEASGALSGRLTEILFGWLIDRGVSAGRLSRLHAAGQPWGERGRKASLALK